VTNSDAKDVSHLVHANQRPPIVYGLSQRHRSEFFPMCPFLLLRLGKETPSLHIKGNEIGETEQHAGHSVDELSVRWTNSNINVMTTFFEINKEETTEDFKKQQVSATAEY